MNKVDMTHLDDFIEQATDRLHLLLSTIFRKFPLTPMGVLAPMSAHPRPSAQPSIDMSRKFPAPVSAE